MLASARVQQVASSQSVADAHDRSTAAAARPAHLPRPSKARPSRHQPVACRLAPIKSQGPRGSSLRRASLLCRSSVDGSRFDADLSDRIEDRNAWIANYQSHAASGGIKHTPAQESEKESPSAVWSKVEDVEYVVPEDKRGDQHAYMYSFAVGIPYGAVIMVLAVVANHTPLAIAGSLSAYTASLAFKQWKRSPLWTRPYTMIQALMSASWAAISFEFWKAGMGVVKSAWPDWIPRGEIGWGPIHLGVNCWPWQPVMWLSVAATIFFVYNLLCGGDPPHKYDRFGIHFKPSKGDMEEEYALDW